MKLHFKVNKKDSQKQANTYSIICYFLAPVVTPAKDTRQIQAYPYSIVCKECPEMSHFILTK